MMHALYVLQYAKGTCWAEAISNSKKIKTYIVLTITELCLQSCIASVNKSISQSINQLVSQYALNKTCSNLLEAFRAGTFGLVYT